MKTKSCIGYAPVVDGEIYGEGFLYERHDATVHSAVLFRGTPYKIIKVEIRPVKKAAKRVRKNKVKK